MVRRISNTNVGNDMSQRDALVSAMELVAISLQTIRDRLLERILSSHAGFLHCCTSYCQKKNAVQKNVSIALSEMIGSSYMEEVATFVSKKMVLLNAKTARS